MTIVLPFIRLIGLTMAGYLLFSLSSMRKYVLPVLTTLVVNVLFPLFFVTRYGLNWNQAIEAGWSWSLWFFLLALGSMGLQFLLGRWIIRRGRIIPRLEAKHHREFLLLFAVHNAGYIPLPIIEVLAPVEVQVFMFAYILAFQLILWSVVVSVISDGKDGRSEFRFRIKPNFPLFGLLLGLVLAITGIYEQLPRGILQPVEEISALAMNGILIVLGGILAGIPREKLRSHPEFRALIIWRQVLYPGVILLLFLVLRLIFDPEGILSPGLPGINETWRWLQLVVVLEACVPPGTNLAILVRSFGNEEQLHYTGTGLIISYGASALIIPVFVTLAIVL